MLKKITIYDISFRRFLKNTEDYSCISGRNKNSKQLSSLCEHDKKIITSILSCAVGMLMEQNIMVHYKGEKFKSRLEEYAFLTLKLHILMVHDNIVNALNDFSRENIFDEYGKEKIRELSCFFLNIYMASHLKIIK